MSFKARLQQAWQEVPVFFLVAPLFYLFLLVLHCVNYVGDYDLPVFWVTLGWLLALLACSAGLVALRRWAGIGFVVIVAARLALNYAFFADHPHAGAEGALADFPLEMLPDIVFGALVLFFFKRLR